MRVSGRSNGTPWKCSITAEADEPSPSIARPPEITSSAASSCATAPGLRLKTLMIEVPMRMLRVSRAITVSHGSVESSHASMPVTAS